MGMVPIFIGIPHPYRWNIDTFGFSHLAVKFGVKPSLIALILIFPLLNIA
jgi:hypothetical protein